MWGHRKAHGPRGPNGACMPVDPETFIDDASSRLEEDREATEALLGAVLKTLGERLTFEQGRKVAATLPEELGGLLLVPKAGQGFSQEEFLERVAERTDVDPETVEEDARVVLSMVGEALPSDVLGKVRDQLPDDLAAFLGPMPGRDQPHPVKQREGTYTHQPTNKEGQRAGKDHTPRYGQQGAR